MTNHIATLQTNHIATMSPSAIAKVREVEAIALKLPQHSIKTVHTFHAGMYGRTIMLPKGVMITGVLVKIPTMLIVSGDVVAYIGGETINLSGYHVLTAEAGRKQAFVANSDSYMTMLFPSAAKTVTEAEEQFTDEAELLLSRR